MKGETVNATWLGGFWPNSRKSGSDENDVIGIMAFEVAGLMSKIVNLWHSLSDNEVMNLREWIVNSVGIRLLVSDDEYFLMELTWNEILNNFQSLSQSVARLGKRCKVPLYHSYENFVHNPFENYVQWSGWEYRWKKMEKKVKKMERFVASMSQLSQEEEVLVECEQTLRRMKLIRGVNEVKLVEFRKKVMCQRNQVQNLRDLSPWCRSYDYIVRLLARSLFTILERIILVFGSCHLPIENQKNDSSTTSNDANNRLALARNHSFPVLNLKQSSVSVHPSETNRNDFCSGPIGSKNKSKKKKKEQQLLHSQDSCGKLLPLEAKQLKNIKSFKGCISVPVRNDSHGGSMRKNIDVNTKLINNKFSHFHRSRVYFKLSLKEKLKPGPSTLGDAALALHYANLIVLIEKIVSAPHTIDVRTRDDLYNKLPTTLKTSLRGKLKWYAKTDASIETEWKVVMKEILEWLAPLAHNMVKWNCERNFEKEHSSLKTSVLLVQTLYFANQAKTEAAMVELLVSLHYVCKIDREGCIRNKRK